MTDAQQMELDPRLTAITDALYRVSTKAIIIHNQRLLMSHEPEGWYSLPGGGMEYGSNVEATIKRELQEELGISPDVVEVNAQLVTANFDVLMGGIPRANLYYRVHLTDYSQVKHSELDYKWVTAAELESITMSPATKATRPLITKLMESETQA